MGSGIAIFGEEGKGGLLIGAYDAGNVIQINDKYKGGVFLGTDEESNSSIGILDVAGNPKWEAP